MDLSGLPLLPLASSVGRVTAIYEVARIGGDEASINYTGAQSILMQCQRPLLLCPAKVAALSLSNSEHQIQRFRASIATTKSTTAQHMSMRFAISVDGNSGHDGLLWVKRKRLKSPRLSTATAAMWMPMLLSTLPMAMLCTYLADACVPCC